MLDTKTCRLIDPGLSSERVPYRDRTTNSRPKLLKGSAIWLNVHKVGSTPRHTDWLTLSAAKWLWIHRCECTQRLQSPVSSNFLFKRQVFVLFWGRRFRLQCWDSCSRGTDTTYADTGTKCCRAAIRESLLLRTKFPDMAQGSFPSKLASYPSNRPRRVVYPHCLDSRVIDGAKFVSRTYRPRSTPRKHYFSASGSHFC
jgi:hypothetical protein